MDLPKCGLYRTTEPIGSVPANRLVYFHNHGDPGPGVYLPETWQLNRARFAKKGTTLPEQNLAFTLEPLPAEGLYRVLEEFTCCEKSCRTFPANLLVQLGYNAQAEPLLFVPELSDAGLALPQLGSKLDADRLTRLAPLKVATPKQQSPDQTVH
jgi:hypothetical protein